MKKTYFILLALVLSVVGASSAMGQKIYRAELDKSMFKAWNGVGAEVQDVEPTPYIGKGGATVEFSVEMNLYKELGAGSLVFGNTNVYSRWYANLTGTKTITFKGTAGVQLRVLMNRPDAEEGAEDPNGGTSLEKNVTIGENGEVTLDVSGEEFPYVHLNAIKTGWGSPAGIVNAIILEGTVKPVTGLLSMINNGDAEGEDLESFPVSYDGPNNGSTANERPERVDGGVSGKCFKVTTFPDPSETWHTQFYIKADEVMEKGTKWKLNMAIKADRECTVTTSAQGAPREWKGGMGIEEFGVTTEWKNMSWEGEISVDGFQSIAFDLNNENGAAGNGDNTFYFDNIEFGIDLGGSNPMSDVTLKYGSDVVEVGLNDMTNMKELVKASTTKTLIFPNDCATVTWNGKTCNVLSIEGYSNGNLYIFLLDMDGEGGDDFSAEDAEVKVSFKNPADEAHRILFKAGKYAGQELPDFSGIVCEYEFEVGEGEYYSYLWGAPMLEKVDPENGSFNLPADMREFNLTFNQKVKVESVVAKLGGEKLTASGDGEYAEVIKLTRTGSANLAGEMELVISAAEGEKGIELEEEIVLSYSFGKIVIDPNDQPKDLLDLTAWNTTNDGAIPEGYAIYYQSEEEPRVAPNTFGSGARMFAFGEGGDFTRGLYFREGYVLYGSLDEFKLEMEANKKYNIRFNSAMWKDSGSQLTFSIASEDDPDTSLYSETVNNTPNVNGSKNAVSGSTVTEISFIPETAGNYLLKWYVAGFNEVIIANPTVKYVPSTMGVEETALLETAIANAIEVRDGNSDERYNGAAFDALVAAITKYEAEKDGYTAPSVFKAAAADLDALAQAMKDHRSLCDKYDPLPAQAQAVIEKYADTKFAVTSIYSNLVATTAKYAVKSTEKGYDEETGEEIDVEVVSARVIKDDAELTTATSELLNAIALAVGSGDVARSGKGMFTDGEPSMGDWSATCTGIAVLVDQIRHGAIAMRELGIDNEQLLNLADNALTDDAEIVDALKRIITKEIYGQLKNADNDLFSTAVDEETLEESEKTYDMTVFVKNPSIYCLNAPAGYKGEETIPGWTAVDFRGFSTGWSDLGTAEIPVGVMFSNWGGSFTVSQEITDLPSGIYTLKAGYGERDTNDDPSTSYFYVKTSEYEEDSITVECPNVGQAFPVDNIEITDVVVTDGKLTLGVQAGQSSHVFFNEVKLYLTGAAPGFDYAKGYEDAVNGIEAPAAVKVRAVELYNLNGRRILSAQKGIQIVKKYMNDGSVRIEKVIKK